MAANSVHLEVTMKATLASEGAGTANIENVYHFFRPNPALALNKADIEAKFQIAIGAKVLLALSIDYQQTNTLIRFIDDALDLAASFTEAGVGAIALPRAPDYVTSCLRFYTATRGKFARGKKFYSPLATASLAGDILTNAQQTLMINLGNGILAGFTDAAGNTWLPEVISRKPPSQLKVNPTTVVSYPITSAILNKTTGRLKRRQRKTVV